MTPKPVAHQSAIDWLYRNIEALGTMDTRGHNPENGLELYHPATETIIYVKAEWPPKKYGVTWATTDHPIAQTGYDFTEDEAVSVAKAHPSVIAHAYPDIQIDAMCNHYPEPCGTLYGRVETEDDAHGEYKVEPERTN